MCQYQDLVKAINNYIRKTDDDLEETLDAEGYADAKGTVEEINKLEDGVADALDEQTKTFLDSLSDAAEQSLSLEVFLADKWPELMENDVLADEIFQLFVDEFTEMMPNLVNNYLMETDAELVADQISKRTSAWIESWSEELSDLMKLNSHTELEKILQDGLTEGKGISDITNDLMDGGIRNTRYEARRVAVTETLRAHSYAKEESLKQSPAVSGKEWVHTGSYRIQPRQNHVDMNGQVVGKDEPFKLIGKDGGTYYPMCPRDTNLPPGESVNCHCTHRAVVDDKVLGLSLEERKRMQAEIISADDEAWEEEQEAENKAKAGIDED